MIYAENVLICITVPLVIALMFLQGSARRFVASFLAGMAACLLAAYVGGYIELVSGLGAEDTAIFLSPIIEEIMKLLPVLFYLMLFEPKDVELLLVAVGIGTGFATLISQKFRATLIMRKYSYMHKMSQAYCAAECAERSWISASSSSLHSWQFCEMAVKTGVLGVISPPL